MIDFYTWTTPNGRKIAIMLEEAGLDYTAHPVNIGQGEQFAADFLKISPNNKIPAIVDRTNPGAPKAVFESGAILIHLAETSGQFLPAGDGRADVLQWLFWQVGGFGPMLGQYGHFRARSDAGDAYAMSRYTEESKRLFGVLDKRLGESEFLGSAYSIADMAVFPWSLPLRPRIEEAAGRTFQNVDRWERMISQRPAVGRGMSVPAIASKGY
ncbi:hypothetical protein GC169_02935 [bacterium]|nr:hypothetical protein [bacterium]